MENGAGRLALVGAIGFLCILIAIYGKLGSILGALIDPASMQDSSANSGTLSPNQLPGSGTLDAAQIGGYALLAKFGSGTDTASQQGLIIAIAVALAESGGNTAAVHNNTNGTTDYGLWQINSVHTQFDSKQLLQPLYNAKAAYTISGGGTNWQAWTTFQTGAYQKYLQQAQAGAEAALLYALGGTTVQGG